MPLTCDALTREDLDATRCGNPLCNRDHPQLMVYPVCHPRQGLDLSYDKITGRMTARCFKCGNMVAVYAVARSELVN